VVVVHIVTGRTGRSETTSERASGGRWPREDPHEAPDRSFIGDRDVLTRSLARYRFVAPHVRGAVVDIGCGRGYGFEWMPHAAKRVGVDLAGIVLADARASFPDVSFVCATAQRLPFADGRFDSLIAFEVIEHVCDGRALLEEARRVTREDGVLAVSTPNRLLASGSDIAPLNPFHTREYTVKEFQQLLGSVFSTVHLFGQRDSPQHQSALSMLLNRIPMRWKFLLTPRLRGLVSVTLRPPLQLAECLFVDDDLLQADTVLALCGR
jgi:SAM-dependent methyltransferase